MHRQTCKEDRVIPFDDLPRIAEIPGDPTTERPATDKELRYLGIFVYDRGGHQVRAWCCGYWDEGQKCGVNDRGEPWPGTLTAGGVGIYRKKRLVHVEKSLQTFEDGKSGGRMRLLSTPLVADDGLTESERLSARTPRIFGDGV